MMGSLPTCSIMLLREFEVLLRCNDGVLTPSIHFKGFKGGLQHDDSLVIIAVEEVRQGTVVQFDDVVAIHGGHGVRVLGIILCNVGARVLLAAFCSGVLFEGLLSTPSKNIALYRNRRGEAFAKEGRDEECCSLISSFWHIRVEQRMEATFFVWTKSGRRQNYVRDEISVRFHMKRF